MDELDLQFFAWWLPELAAADGPDPVDGRLRGRIELVAKDLDDDNDADSHPIEFDLFGPGDAVGLGPRAVVRTFPSSGSRRAERDKAVHVELRAADLPWRHTIDRPSGRLLTPWLVLLVGRPDELGVEGQVVEASPAVLDRHPPDSWPAGAHVEQDVTNPDSPPVSRLVSYQPLEADTDYVAVVVPAFEPDGSPRWTSPASTTVLPAYHHWRFRTKVGGDFAALARRLRPQPTGPTVGLATLEYEPLPDEPPMTIRGALTSIGGGTDGNQIPPSVAVADDLRILTSPLGSEQRPVVGLPDYDRSWPSDEPTATEIGWRSELRRDPRRRGVAGLGAEAGVVEQERLARAASRAAGAFQEASERLRRLGYGVLVSGSLWRRRVPDDGPGRLSLLGPALRTVNTAAGPVTDQLTKPGLALGGALFSTAAKRAWRPRPGADPSLHPSVLAEAAVPPPRPGRNRTPIAHTDGLAESSGRVPLDELVTSRPPSLRRLQPLLTDLDRRFDSTGFDRDTRRALRDGVTSIRRRLGRSQPLAILPLLDLLDPTDRRKPSRRRVRDRIAALADSPDTNDLAQLGQLLTTPPKQDSPAAVPLDTVSAAVASAFDPNRADSSLVDRFLAEVTGFEDDPLRPVELEPELGLAAWRFLRSTAPEWLLPGAEDLPTDSVVSLSTNPAFVDAYLVGLNAQLLAELRFRNLPILAGWTPIRTFWQRTNPATGSTDADIVDIQTWTAPSIFGSAQHQTPSASTADLVVLFTTPLFREYPGTVVYLAPAPTDANGRPDWDEDPVLDAAVFPTFQGQLGPDQVFFGFDAEPALIAEVWVVLEETVRGRRFSAGGPALPPSGDGAGRAAGSVVPPRRVLIQGQRLAEGLDS